MTRVMRFTHSFALSFWQTLKQNTRFGVFKLNLLLLMSTALLFSSIRRSFLSTLFLKYRSLGSTVRTIFRYWKKYHLFRLSIWPDLTMSSLRTIRCELNPESKSVRLLIVSNPFVLIEVDHSKRTFFGPVRCLLIFFEIRQIGSLPKGGDFLWRFKNWIPLKNSWFFRFSKLSLVPFWPEPRRSKGWSLSKDWIRSIAGSGMFAGIVNLLSRILSNIIC